MNGVSLESRADRLGIATSYTDVDGTIRRASPAALAALVDLLDGHDESGPAPAFDRVVVIRGGRWTSGVASRFESVVDVSIELDDGRAIAPVKVDSPGALDRELPGESIPIGVHTLRWRQGGRGGEATLLAAPRRFPRSARAEPGTALFAPAYALWSVDAPLPCYEGLARLGEATATLGIDTIAALPLHAPGLGPRFDPSPYSPLSRFHWNELLVDDVRLGRAPGPPDPAPVDASGRLDWGALHRHRLAALDAFVPGPAEARELDEFLVDRPDVVTYAGWAGGGDPVAARRHEVGQWLAEQSLKECSRRLRTRGQALALDLPVGARADSWETHRWPDLFVRGASIGAPPDTFFSGGQDWGLPPMSPSASRRDGHRVWHRLLVTLCRFADVVRIDHVMQVFRLWWVPHGHAADDGAYVRYPAQELLAVAAIVAETTGTFMVGEDLGTVSPEVGAVLADWGLVGMHEEAFTLHGVSGGDGVPDSLPAVPPDTWAGVRTHDMAPLAVTLAEVDSAPYRLALGAELGRPVADDTEDLLPAMVERLRAGGVVEVVVDLDDVFGVTTPHNTPGTTGPSNWSRRFAAPIERIATDPRLMALHPQSPRCPDPDHRGAP